MPLLIDNGEQLVTLLVDHFGFSRSRNAGKCPYCHDGADSDDRFQLATDARDGLPRIRVWCRKGWSLGRHKNPVSIEELFADIGIEVTLGDAEQIVKTIPATFVTTSSSGARSNVDNALDLAQYAETYIDSDTSAQWLEMGFSVATVRHFGLGCGTVKGRQRLTIPVPVDPFVGRDTVVIKSRGLPGDRKHDASFPNPILYLDAFDENRYRLPLDTLYIVEGERSLIAAWQMGLRPVVTSTSGSGNWLDEWTRALLARGARNFVFVPDHDEAGYGYVAKIVRSINNIADELVIESDDVNLTLVNWPEGTQEKYDVYDVLHDFDTDDGAAFLRDLIDSADTKTLTEYSGTVRQRFLKDEFAEVVDDEPVPVATLRDRDDTLSISYRLTDFVDNYLEKYYTKAEPEYAIEERGTVLLVRAKPGVGKTYSARELAEHVAMSRREKAERADSQRIRRLGDILEALGYDHPEHAQDRAKHKLRIKQYLSHIVFEDADANPDTEYIDQLVAAAQHNLGIAQRFAVGYFGPFIAGYDELVSDTAHPDLWHNLEARTDQNCRLYNLQAIIASRGYMPMKTLCRSGGHCPFADMCLEDGYLRQFVELAQMPIVYMRHNQLLSRTLIGMPELIIIDEDPNAIYLDRRVIHEQDIDDPDSVSDMFEDDEQRLAVKVIFRVLRDVARYRDEHEGPVIINGPAVLALVDAMLRKYATSLKVLANTITQETIDTLNGRTPFGIGDEELAVNIPVRFVATLVEALVHESRLYGEHDNWNSRINMVSASFVFYELPPFAIDPRIPVIILDATGKKEEYRHSFPRHNLKVYSPDVRNDATSTVTFIGAGEWSKTSLLTGVRELKVPARTEHLLSRSPIREPDYAGILRRLGTYKYPNGSLRKAMQLSAILALRHRELLAVTHMAVERWLTAHTKLEFPTLVPYIEWAHFQSLRGSNAFKNMPAALVIGTPRPPRDVMKLQLSALYSYDSEPLDFSMDVHPVRYHGTPHGYEVYRFNDPRAWFMVDKYEVDEVVQCGERVRPHTSSDPKHLYYASARPAGRWITDIVHYTDWRNEFIVGPLRAMELLDRFGTEALEFGKTKIREELSSGHAVAVATHGALSKLDENLDMRAMLW